MLIARGFVLVLAAGNVIELGKNEQVLVTGERPVHRNRLRYIADGAANLDWLVVIENPPTRASPEDGGNRVVSILIVVLLPAPFEPSNPNTSRH